MKIDAEILASLPVYDASGEQVQQWHYHARVGRHASPQLLKLDATLKEPDIMSLEKAIEILFRRHESLRTCFQVIEGRIMQCIMPYDKEVFSPLHYDLRTAKDPRKAVSGIADSYRDTLKDIAAPPLLRCGIFRISADTWYFLMLIHHIISDDWSMQLIHQELYTSYESFRTGRPLKTDPLPVQLKDYAAWQKKWLEEHKKVIFSYWDSKLRPFQGAGMPGNRQEMQDILDHSGTGLVSYPAGLSLYNGLKALSTSCRASLASVLTAGLRLLFLLLRGRERILLAMPVAGRHFPGAESIIGCLMGGIYQCPVLRKDISIKELVRETYIDFLESFRHIIYNHDELGLDEPALRVHCDIFVNFLDKRMTGGRKLPKQENSRGHRAGGGPGYYALTFIITEYEDGLSFLVKYNQQLYSSETIDLLTSTLESILHAMCRNPELMIKDLILLC